MYAWQNFIHFVTMFYIYLHYIKIFILKLQVFEIVIFISTNTIYIS